jgi:hypothetical protein
LVVLSSAICRLRLLMQGKRAEGRSVPFHFRAGWGLW